MLGVELRTKAFQRVKMYRSKADGAMTESMIEECKMQFIEMAQGGDGSIAMMGNIRDEYYKNHPDKFFQLVCDMMGWEWSKES
tara:strand:- start:2 stop:250 length:249 start_codon:yes stop_codon:yes gene_type:complete